MLQFYYLWCIISFIIGIIIFLIYLYHYIFEKTDIEIENYKEIWLRYNFFDMWFSEMKSNWSDFIFNFFLYFIIAPLLSWISVIFYIFVLIKVIKSKYIDLPKDVREGIKKNKFKLKNTKISSKKELYETIYFINHWQEIDETSDLSESFLLWDIDTTTERMLELGDRSHLYIYYNKVRVRECNVPLVTAVIFDYKIEWNKVLVKLKEQYFEYPWKEDYIPVSNWKINKDIIENEFESGGYLPTDSLEDIIKRYKNAVKWYELGENRKYYILYYNLSTKEFKNYANTELEKLKLISDLFKEIEEKYKDGTLTIKKEKTYIDKKLKEYWLTEKDWLIHPYCNERIRILENIINWELKN